MQRHLPGVVNDYQWLQRRRSTKNIKKYILLVKNERELLLYLTHVAFSDVCRCRLGIEGISTVPSGYSKLSCCLLSRDAENV